MRKWKSELPDVILRKRERGENETVDYQETLDKIRRSEKKKRKIKDNEVGPITNWGEA